MFEELEKWTVAQRRAWTFLLGIGRLEEENGKKVYKEVLPGTIEEKNEIKNLISVLRDNPPKEIISAIAKLLEGDENKHTWHRRTLKFGFAGKGRPKKHIKIFAIRRIIQTFIDAGFSVEQAIAEASESLDQGTDQLWKIWKAPTKREK